MAHHSSWVGCWMLFLSSTALFLKLAQTALFRRFLCKTSQNSYFLSLSLSSVFQYLNHSYSSPNLMEVSEPLCNQHTARTRSWLCFSLVPLRTQHGCSRSGAAGTAARSNARPALRLPHAWRAPFPAVASYHGDVALQELVDSRQIGAGRLGRVETLAPAAKRSTSAGGCQLLAAEMQALQLDWKQWEESAFQSQRSLRDVLSQMAVSEQEFAAQVARLEEAVQRFGGLLADWSQSLAPLDSRHTDAEIVESWRKEKVSSLLFSKRFLGCKCTMTEDRQLLPGGTVKEWEK